MSVIRCIPPTVTNHPTVSRARRLAIDTFMEALGDRDHSMGAPLLCHSCAGMSCSGPRPMHTLSRLGLHLRLGFNGGCCLTQEDATIPCRPWWPMPSGRGTAQRRLGPHHYKDGNDTMVYPKNNFSSPRQQFYTMCVVGYSSRGVWVDVHPRSSLQERVPLEWMRVAWRHSHGGHARHPMTPIRVHPQRGRALCE